jgi:hypothetical protein
MKIKTFFFLLLLVFAFASSSPGQSVSITSRRVTYNRPHPSSEDKAKIVVDYPIVKAATRSLSRKIAQTIEFSSAMNVDLKRESNGEDQWLEAAGFDVDINKNGILCVTLWASGTGQFWSILSRPVVIDLKTGNRVTANMVFTNLSGLAAVVKKHQAAEVAQAKIDIPKMEGYSDLDTNELFELTDFTVQRLREFAVTRDGLVFKYDYGFPRLIVDAQPQGVYLIPWSEAKPFIRRRGLLRKFIY